MDDVSGLRNLAHRLADMEEKRVEDELIMTVEHLTRKDGRAMVRVHVDDGEDVDEEFRCRDITKVMFDACSDAMLVFRMRSLFGLDEKAPIFYKGLLYRDQLLYRDHLDVPRPFG